MRRTRLDDRDCSIAKTVDAVGDPWTLLIVRDALVGVARFEDLQRRLGTPRATLANRLARLVEHGVLHKDEDGGYHLTDKGRALRPVLITMMQWGDRWVRDDEPPTKLIDAETGRSIRPILVDGETGTPIDQLQVRAEGPLVEGLPRRSDRDL